MAGEYKVLQESIGTRLWHVGTKRASTGGDSATTRNKKAKVEKELSKNSKKGLAKVRLRLTSPAHID